MAFSFFKGKAASGDSANSAIGLESGLVRKLIIATCIDHKFGLNKYTPLSSNKGRMGSIRSAQLLGCFYIIYPRDNQAVLDIPSQCCCVSRCSR